MTHEDIEGDDVEDTRSTQKQHQADMMKTCSGLQQVMRGPWRGQVEDTGKIYKRAHKGMKKKQRDTMKT